jgi:hypothetical protein
MESAKSIYDTCFKKSKTVFEACLAIYDLDSSKGLTAVEFKECNAMRNIFESTCVKMNIEKAQHKTTK